MHRPNLIGGPFRPLPLWFHQLLPSSDIHYNLITFHSGSFSAGVLSDSSPFFYLCLNSFFHPRAPQSQTGLERCALSVMREHNKSVVFVSVKEDSFSSPVVDRFGFSLSADFRAPPPLPPAPHSKRRFEFLVHVNDAFPTFTLFLARNRFIFQLDNLFPIIGNWVPLRNNADITRNLNDNSYF